MRGAAALGVAASIFGILACGAANVRPYVAPFAGAPIDTVRGDPAVIVGDLAGLLQAEGVTVRRQSPEEGYVESAWFDVRGTSLTGPTPHGPLVRFRFWVDPVGNGLAQVIGEVAGRYTVDPSLPERQREVLLPPEHVGRVVLARIMESVALQFK